MIWLAVLIIGLSILAVIDFCARNFVRAVFEAWSVLMIVALIWLNVRAGLGL